MKKIIFSIFTFSLFFYFGYKTSPSVIDSFIPKAEFNLKPNFGSIYKNIDDYFGSSLALKLETFKIVESMSDEQKAGMLLMPAFEEGNSYDELRSWLREYNIGGFMVLRGIISSDQINSLNVIGSSIDLPLFVSLDAEPSLIRNRVSELPQALPTSQIESLEQSIDQATLISEYLVENGYNLNFAPVYDSDENRSVIGNRSFGGNSENISLLAGVFSETSKNKGILTTAKHFPGHGSVSGDTHLSLQVIKDELVELANFKSAIDQEIPFVMVGHLAVSSENQEIDTNNLPATLSEKIMVDVLKKDLGFEGLVITDAMNMGALNQFNNLNIRSLKAGADILLMPRDLDLAHKEILDEMKNSEEFRKLVDQKVRKIVRMKLVLKWLE